MITRPHELFARALSTHVALGAFNTSNLEFSQAIIGAAAAQSAPVIIQTSESAIAYAGLKPLTALIRALADEVAVPVILHLDHGKSLDTARRCIAAGYTSVMIDLSALPYDENIAGTRQVVEYAHDRGVWVEAELGKIIGKEGAQGLHGSRTPDSLLTDPTQAKKFVTATGVDALAVSVGTIHGAYKGQEYIRFELLEAIAALLPETPLVLHGASGITDSDLRRAITMNVCKINVDTELRQAFDRGLRAALQEASTLLDPRVVLGNARDAVQAVVEAKMKIFSSATLH